MASGDIIIGIDLGTTNSVVAYLEGHEPVIVPNAEGRGKTPSTVAFLENGDVLTGEVARRQAATQPQRTISSAKRLIGRFKSELDEEAEIYPFEIGEDEKGRAIVLVDGVAYSPQQISALILQKLKLSAEEYLERPVSKAIITVPAYFDDVQRHATLEAAELAGLEVPRLINEPTAAAMAYGLGKKCQETVAIYDFGGGTFDFSILEIDENIFEVLTSTGNSRLGGDDVDMALVDHVADEFLEKHRIDLRDDLLTFRRLKDEMERVKCELSTATTSIISLPFIAYSNGSPVHLERTLNRETLEEIIEPFIAETLECCDRALRDSGVKKKDITKVILVGGSTRTPLVQEMVEDFFGIAPFRGVNPDEVVSIGAAMQGAVMAGDLEEVVLLDVTPHSLSIEVKGDRRSMLIEKNSTIPIKIARHFTTAEDNQSFVNVHLLQGEEDKASDNRSLGKFTLSGLPEAKAGQPRIRVEIFVNADGVVELSAFEEQSGKQEKLTTSFNYLDADERRKRQGLRTGRGRKNRRLRNGALTETQRRRILESSPVVGSTVSSAPVAEAEEKPYSPSGTRRPVAPTPEEALSESRVRGRGGTSAGTRRRPKPMGTKPSPSLSGTGSILERGPVMAEASAAAEAWENSERSATAAASARVAPTDTDTDRRTPRDPSDSESGSTQRVARPEIMPHKSATPPIVKNSPSKADSKVSTGAGLSDSWPMQPSEAFDLHIEVPATLSDLVDRLNEGMAEEAAELYQKLEADFLGFCEAHTADVAVQALKAKCLIVSRQPEEARAIIAGIGEACPEHKRDVLALYGMLCRQYPNYVAARWDRALLATQLGEHRLAMNDLEFVAKRETSGTAVYDDLQHVYEKALEESWDATIQFKLVKMHLRRGDLDDAITLLQQLVQIPGYRERADKVLGLCFWQKGLRYLALQKFKSQPMTDEIKDILYRLSADMEENDELLHAKYALERVYESDISFRDVAERLRRIAYRVDLMKDKRYGAIEPSGEASGGEENPSLLGDRFELVCEINRGSMGIVYKAHDRSLDEIVALKVLNDFLVSDPEAVRRFKQEARSARRLAHPNIVRIHDFLDLDHKKLISMEFIEGEDLKTILARNATLSSEMVIFYLRQICDAMAYAHALGIVHRDIKPANIMIDDRNAVKVTDFGIAKVIGKAATNNGTMVMGTPLYMSPEQIQGGRIDPRADIYALGIMLYELVTGSPPFYEGNIDYQHCHKPVPPITIGIDEKFKSLIYCCVEKRPDDRFQSITELLEAVAAIET